MKRLRLAMVPWIAAALLATCAPAPVASAADPLPAKFTEQSISWHTCTKDELLGTTPPSGMLCGTYITPLDWDDRANGKYITVAVSKLKPTSGTASKSVLVNPGGPGSPGRAFPARFTYRSKLRAAYDIIGFDPRGTGQSTNITCGGAARALDPLDPRDRTAHNLDLILSTTENAVQSCHQRSGELGPLVSTYQTVRDLDLLRYLLKRSKISWIGYSAGTWMGAQYATRYPSRVNKFVLDSNTEFTNDWQASFNWQPLGFERRWRADFLPWMAQYDDLYHYGRTAAAALQTYEDVRARLQQSPVTRNGKTIGPNQYDTQITNAMYNKSSFPGLGEYLSAVRDLTDQQASAAQRSAARSTLHELHVDDVSAGPRPLVVRYGDATNATFWSVPCNETVWSGDRQSVVSESQRVGEQYPLTGWSRVIEPCVFWANEPVALPTPTGAGLPSVLMVQSTHDAATPLEGATRAHERFAGSRMLTVTNEGDHGLYAGGNACVDRIVESFLVDAVVPIQDTSCKGMPLPNPATARAEAPRYVAITDMGDTP